MSKVFSYERLASSVYSGVYSGVSRVSICIYLYIRDSVVLFRAAGVIGP